MFGPTKIIWYVLYYMDQTLVSILTEIENGQSLFLLGPGGTGKSFIIRHIAAILASKGKKVACTAATGIAAINLSVPEAHIAGSTIHSWAGVGLADQPPLKLVARITHDERARKRWLETDVLFLDEISMVGAILMDKLDYVGRSIRRTPNKPFGGIQLICSGDFLQLPPVKEKWAFQSMVWINDLGSSLIHYLLDEPKRYEDRDWFDMLLRIRKGHQTKEDIKFLRTRQIAYDAWLKTITKDALIVKPTVLNSRRMDVDFENDQELEKLSGSLRDFVAVDDFKPRNNHARVEHYMKQLDDAIPKYIHLKVGAQVMLKANLDISEGLANGSRGVVIGMFDTGVQVKWRNNKTTMVASHTWIQEDKDGKAVRNQIPLILAWSLTIHKCQGCTLDYAICNLGPSIFCPGQAYVALSRVRSSDGLFLSEFYPSSIKADQDALEYTENVEKAQSDVFDFSPKSDSDHGSEVDFSPKSDSDHGSEVETSESDNETKYVLNFIDC